MRTAELAEKFVKELPQLKLVKFRRWLMAFDAAAWAAQVGAGAAAGKLEAAANGE